MTKLSQFIPPFAQRLGLRDLPEESVKVIAKHLRGRGLLSSQGRGRGGAEMVSRDASNLVIGTLCGGGAVYAPARVSAFRAMQMETTSYVAPDGQWKVSPKPPLEGGDFGSALDALFEALSTSGEIFFPGTKDAAFEGGVIIREPTIVGTEAVIRLRFDRHDDWITTYRTDLIDRRIAKNIVGAVRATTLELPVLKDIALLLAAPSEESARGREHNVSRKSRRAVRTPQKAKPTHRRKK